MKCLEIKVTPVLVLGIWLVLSVPSVAGSSWYLGCTHDNASSDVTGSLPVLQDLEGNSVFTPASCAGSCRERGFLYARIHEQGANCTCNSLIGDEIADEQCNITCGNINLPCGGDGVASVYSVDGPYLLTAELWQMQRAVQEGATVRFEARVALATEERADLGVGGFNASDLDEIVFRWRVDGELSTETAVLRRGNATAVGSFVYTFHRHGRWHVDLEVSNAISRLRRTTDIVVVRPLPSDLQVILQPTEGDAPSCVPVSGAVAASRPAVAVFVDEEVGFQASVAMGVNLTFEWTFTGDVWNVTEVSTKEADCQVIACMQDFQVHTFPAEGLYDVVVNVSNALGSVQKTLHLVAVSREISNLTLSLSSNSAFVSKVNDTLGLLVTLATTARQQVVLQVDFGDGAVFNHSMYDVDDTFIAVGGEESAHLHLTASYGDEGCILFVSLSHRYRHAGVFAVEADVFQSWDTRSAGTAELASAVIVQEALGPVQLETQGVYPTHSPANFSLVMPADAANVSYSWSVTSDNATVDLACYVEPTCVHNFTRPGRYLLRVSAANLVSTAHAQEGISIQEVITGLSLNGGSGGIMPTGAMVPFTASAETGSDARFTWHFPDSLEATAQRDLLLEGVPTSQANHTFDASGDYNVSVTARNDVSRETAYLLRGVQVQDPILGLSVVSAGPTLLGRPARVNVTLRQGTRVAFAVKTESGRVVPNVQHLGEDSSYILELAIAVSGVFHTIVVASNNVSSQNATLCVVVQEPPGTVSIQEFDPGNGQIVLLARLDGEIPHRTDVMYTWQARGRNLTSASPVLTLPVWSQPETVVVQASNQVGVSQEERVVDITTPQTKYSLDWPAFGEAGEPTTFSLQVSEDCEVAPVQVLVDHGDGAPNVTRMATPGLPLVWNRTLPDPGVYPLRLWYSCGEQDVLGETVTVFQRRIEGVRIVGPELSKFFGPVTTQTWEVASVTGTDVLYTWTVTPILADSSHGPATNAGVTAATVTLAGSHGRVSLPFHAPGRYNLTLDASNLISSATRHSQTTLQQPIVQAAVHVPSVLIGTPSTYRLVVRGGPPFRFQVDLGTESSGLLSTTSEELASRGYETLDYLLDPPACVYTFEQTYPDLGWYDGSFRVENLVSEATVAATAKVEEWITGLALASRSDALVTIGHSVVLEATVETGNDIVFTWDFQDALNDPTLLNCLNGSTATHSFSRPGAYRVSVSAGNPLQPTPVRVTLPIPFLVQEPPFGLELSAPAGRPRGAALNPGATEVLSFRAQCWGSHLVFYFDYGDGTLETVPGMLDEYGTFRASGSHQYFQEGNYTVSVTAGNQLSNVTSSLPRLYYVRVPPTSLRCERPFSAHAFGNVSHLVVRVETGTHLFYNWSMGDQTDYIDVGPSVSHLYRAPGTYTVTVVASNEVQTARASCRVSVEVPVQGVELLVDRRLHETYARIRLEARTVTDSALWYHWDLGDQRDVQITSVNTLTTLYTYHDRYYVTVLAGNHVSNATSLPVELTLQTAVQRVSVHAPSAVLVNRSVRLEAWIQGSDENLVWDFGDGTERLYTAAKTVHHSYNRTGEFVLRLEASNLVSNATATSKIFVLTTMCHAPVLDIVGSDPRTVRHSQDIRVEAEVAIDCDITNLALYSWSVASSQNGTEVSLLQDRASLDRRTLYIPRWDLPYGSYTFTLSVVMNDTIVYAQDSITLDVVRSPLVSIIEGGTRRYFGPDMVATLNGSFSYDPDDRDSSNYGLRYSWTCHPLGLVTADCFNATALSAANQTSILPSPNASLVFPTSWLLPNHSRSFVFTLRVGKEGRADAEVTQVLTLVQQAEGVGSRQMQVSVDCLRCEGGIVNANEPLTLEAVCPECDENTTYIWELYVVLDGVTSSSFYDLTSGLRCNPGDGSYGRYLVANESSPSPPSSNPEEDSNIINQGTQAIETSTLQNGVSNAINPGLLPSDGMDEDSDATSSNSNSSSRNQISGSSVGGTASAASATTSAGVDLPFASLTEDTGSSFEEDVGADAEVTEALATSGTPTAITSHNVTSADHLNGNSSEQVGGSLDEATSSLGEAFSSFLEAGGSVGEAVESPEEAGGSFVEGGGSLAEAGYSFDEAGGSLGEAVGSSFAEDLPGSASSNDTSTSSADGTVAPTAGDSQMGGSFEEGSQEASFPSQDYPEAVDSTIEDTGTGQQSQSVSQPEDLPNDDYPEEYLGYSDELEQHPPPPSDPNTGDDADGRDQVVNPDAEVTARQHVVALPLQQRVLRPADTAAGLGRRALTVHPGLLDENRTYALVMSARSKENGIVRTGEAQQYVWVNRGPRAGVCSVTPRRGNEMDTVFTINCGSWRDEHSPIQYEVSYSLNETEDLTILYFGMKHAIKFQLPAGYEDNGHLVFVKVSIVDGQGGRTSVCSITIDVQPKTFAPGESVEEFLYNVTLAESNRLTMYIQHGDQQNLNGFINTVACILNRQPALSPDNSNYLWLLSLRRQIRFALVSAALALPRRDQFEVRQSSMATAASSYVPLELQVDTVVLAAHAVNSGTVSAVASARLLGQLDVDILVALTSTVSGVVSALAMDHTRAIGVQQRKLAVRSSLGAVTELLQTYLQLQEPDAEPLLIQTSSVDLLGARLPSLASAGLAAGANAFLLPPGGLERALHAQNGGEGAIGAYRYRDKAVPCWSVDVVTFKDNPYLWGAGADKVTTDVSSLTLHSCTGRELRVGNLTGGREVVFEAAHSCGSLGDSLTCNLTIDKAFMNVHAFDVLPENVGQTFQAMVRLAPEPRRTFPVKLIMRYGAQPTPTEYDNSWLYDNEGEDLVIFLPPNTFNASGTYYIALINGNYNKVGYGQDVSQRQYLIRLWWGECLYWNAGNEAWVGDGCSVMPSSTYERTRCRCDHLTTFGVAFLPIAFVLDVVSLAVFDTPNTNPITYSFTAGILSIYLLLCIYCYLADKHDGRKLGLIYLADNQPADQQYYEITVETGMRAGAGTTARVSVVLHGSEGHSETKELICTGRPIFEKNSRDRFIVSVPESLGSLRRVHIWHNNAGHSPSWFLSRVAVRDLLTGHKWYFICERWFAVEEDDGEIERDLEVLDKGVGFQKAFFAKLFQYFADYYLWSSIFTRPPYSVFTRVQRLTCCLSISMGFLCINTIWYQHLDKEEVDLGLIDVSAENMLVGIVTAILAIPVNFPVIMVFRRARPRRDDIEEEKNFRSVKATIDLPESAAPLETILDQGRLYSGLSEPSNVNLDDLPGWVQEKWRQRLKGSSSHSDQTRNSYDSLSFTTSSSSSLTYDEPAATSPPGSGRAAARRPATDSGVSSPDSRSLRSSGYLPAAVAAAGWQADHKRLASPKVWLPTWCGTLAWAVCGLITVFSAVVSIYYGYRFSDVKSVYWMQSVYFSFLQCIFVTQPAVMLMFTILKSVRHRNNVHIFDHYDDNIDLIDKKSLERARLEVYETDVNKAIAARQRSRYLRFARPPQPRELQEAKAKMLKEKNMWAILKDVIMYSTLLSCLVWMAYGREVAYHLPVNQGVRQTYLQTPRPFAAVASVEDLWSWMHGDLLDGLYWQEWYNADTVLEEKNSIMNGESVLLGKASLRQVRVRHHSCPVAGPARPLFPDCKAGYGPRAASTRPFGPGHGWTHRPKGELRRYSRWGYLGSYDGDGYAVSLNSSREETRKQLAYLRNNSWIDELTRAVIVEFTIYNAPTNLYTSVSLLAEMPGTGGVNPFPKIESVLLYRYETVYDYFIMCCELLFLLLVAVSCKREVQKLVKIRAAFFKSAWSWMEMSMILLSLTYFAMYVCRFMYVNKATQHLRETYLEEFVDFSLLAYWDQILKDLLACLIFLSSVKLLRLLRFNQTVAMFGAVIDGAIKDILTFALYLLVLEAAFASLGVLLFSAHFYPLKHLYVASSVLNAVAVGWPPGDADPSAESPGLWYLFYFAYAFSVIIFMAGLMKAILCRSFRQVKQRCVQAVGVKEVVGFFWDKFLIRVGLREPPEEDKPTALPTEFTMAEIEYQLDELLFRMSAVTHQHSLPEKPYRYSEDSDATHMLEDGISSTCSEFNSIDSSQLEDRTQKMEALLYSHNPEPGDGHCCRDEDSEKQLRSRLEILKQLRRHRLLRELHDSGHDTQSTSELGMELGSDCASAEHPLSPTPEPLNVRDAQGRPTFPKPLPNLGPIETDPASVRPPSASLTNRKQAWGQSSSAEAKPGGRGCVATRGPPRVSTPQDRLPRRRPSTGDAARRPYTAGVVPKGSRPKHRLKPTSASVNRPDQHPLGSSSEVLDSQSGSSSSGFIHRTESVSSRGSDLVTSGGRGGTAVRAEPVLRLDQLVRDCPEEDRLIVGRAFSTDSFPLPNALDSLSSGSDGGEAVPPAREHKGGRETEARHRLRKTRSRGKGKGRSRFDEAVYVNEAFSSDSNEEVPVIHMGPTQHHERK